MENALRQEFVYFKSEINEFISDMRKYLLNINADFCIFFLLRDKKAKKVLEIITQRNTLINRSCSIINIDNNVSVNKMLTEKKVIINKDKKDNLIDNSVNEIYVPIIKENYIIGFIYIGNQKPKKIILNISELNKIINKYAYELLEIEKQEWGKELLKKTFTLINEIFKSKSEFMNKHAYNVASWAITIAKKLNLSEEKLFKIYIAALMHDMGKIFIDENIVNKEGKLTQAEYEEMKKHVEIGYNYFNEIAGPFAYTEISRWIFEHHEKWDGSGYPNKLKGEQISIGGRILKIADSIDAILSEKNYKKSKDLPEAIIELIKCKGKDFDPKIADIAIEILKMRINYLDYSFEEPIIPGKLAFQLKDGFYYMNGYVEKNNNIMTFNTIKPITDISKKDITDISLTIERLNIVFEYSAKIEEIVENEIALSKLEGKDTKKSFGLLWVLNGKLIIPRTKRIIDVIITKISGNDLVFNLENKIELDKEPIYLMYVYFEDNTKILLTGKIVNEIKINNNIHYKLEFIGIKEKYRDEVFRQIFRKQIKMRNMINNIF